MFRPTDRQLSLLGAASGLSKGARRRLERTWAEGFRQHVMPLLLKAEPSFARLYASGGRPNWSVARLLGLLLLKEQLRLDDQQMLDALSFDARFHHALDVTTEQAYLSRRSLAGFRRRLVVHDPEGELLREVFDRVCATAVVELGVSTAEQRIDSTLVVSNIRSHGRVSLARETLRVFVARLSEAQRQELPETVQQWWQAQSPDGWSHEDDDKQSRRRTLAQLGVLAQQALGAFAQDEAVRESQAYGSLSRLVSEHAAELGLPLPEETEEGPEHDSDDGDASPPLGPPRSSSKASKKGAAKRPRRRRKSRKKPKKARYWTPHDPDASFGHKGLGYHVHVTETCRNEGTELLTDYDVLTAACSDNGRAMPALSRLAERGLRPTELYADGGYPTPENLVVARQDGTELQAPVNRGRMAKDCMSRADFVFDDTGTRVLACPQGHPPTRHAERESSDARNPRRALHVFFDASTCGDCSQRRQCPVRRPNNKRSKETRLELSAELLARDRRWAEQHTEPWKERYRIRAGVEATISELKRTHDLGRLRVRTRPRVLLAVALKMTACNLKRWLRARLALLYAFLSALGRSPAVLAP